MTNPPEPHGILPATPENIRLAAERVREGALVIIPTETVYGVAVRPEFPEAMARLYAAKGREDSKRVAFFADGIESVRSSGSQVNVAAEGLAAAFWPGPLTLVLKNAKGNWDGFRMPDHAIALAWLRELDFLPVVTSANRSGKPATRTARDAWDALEPHVALALDAGPAEGGVASTVVRVENEFIELLREGPLSHEALEQASGLPIRR